MKLVGFLLMREGLKAQDRVTLTESYFNNDTVITRNSHDHLRFDGLVAGGDFSKLAP